MNRHEFSELIRRKVVILDGATGTELAKRGLAPGVCPEAWILEHPEAILDLQSQYVAAGSDIIYAPTFGVNRHKLSNFGLERHVSEMNRRLAALSLQASGGRARVFGDLAPTGLMVQPMPGGAPFEEVVDIYKEQARALLDAGVDGFAIETMLDIQEARAALIAVRELSSDVPVIVSMTYEQDGRTLTGTSPSAAVVILQSLGADAIGCNCSAGPVEMAAHIAAMRPYAHVPLVAKPNAGLPKTVDGKTCFELDGAAFADCAEELVAAGAGLVGGCCGTSPEHIRLLSEKASGLLVPSAAADVPSCLASSRQIRVVSPAQPFAIIGERINPTGKKALQAELRQNQFALVRAYAREQEQGGAAILDVNLGLPGGDEKALMTQAVTFLAADMSLPLCIDTTKPDVAEAALRLYPGRALFNSISAETSRLREVLPVVAKYGAMIVILPLDDHGIPQTAAERIALVETVFGEAQKYGYTKADVAVDGLVMTVSANPEAAKVTLDLIEWTSRVWKTNAVCGLSNVSFGLPRRDLVNRAFLGMAIGRGLNMAIANPMMPDIVETVMASDVLSGRDGLASAYIGRYANTAAPTSTRPAARDATIQDGGNTVGTGQGSAAATVTDRIGACVLNGDDSSLAALLAEALKGGSQAGELVDGTLIPAITAVGDRYEKKAIYLPQLLASAKAMRTGMDFLTPYLKKGSVKEQDSVPFILATVQGDIHDIGKNIVAMMLNNYGFRVIDLGKDVPAEVILDRAVAEGACLVGLSALMTTTMVRMKDVIDLAKARGLSGLTFIVGGAVVDQAFADSIGAHYAEDAMAAVRLAQRLSGK